MPPKQNNKLSKSQKNLIRWKAALDIATDMVLQASNAGAATAAAPVSVATVTSALADLSTIGSDDEDSGRQPMARATTTNINKGSSTTTLYSPQQCEEGIWFISVDIEAYESKQDLILEIGWSICDPSSGKDTFIDNHYAISDYRHLVNKKFVDSRPDMFGFGETVWANLQDAIAAFQQDLEKAASRNKDERFVLIAHDMASDMKYLSGMGVVFPKGMVQFDTQEMNAARVGNGACKMGLGSLLDEVNIENYSLHNAGNDAHYTMQLFLWLARNNGSLMV
ncbi:hypothetical protein BGZ95_011982 [Linnemannia exigua]|uniref:Gfd2/YDR514C-like C-terminal domain-containing protein n=1 Tax=Linnemannia exigua TaxID=604196 RepID=A0AAD4DJM2_9FUNG|nr:hypothetical protein BGZ95_011982 [Linnemannia exigua]